MRKTLAGGWHNSTGVCSRQRSELEILYRRRYSAPAFGPGSDRNGVVGVCVIYTGFSGVVVWRPPVRKYVIAYICLRCHNDTVVERAFVS